MSCSHYGRLASRWLWCRCSMVGGGVVANLAGPTARAGRRCSHLGLHTAAEHWRAELLPPACCCCCSAHTEDGVFCVLSGK